jgi:hypothetical protein
MKRNFFLKVMAVIGLLIYGIVVVAVLFAAIKYTIQTPKIKQDAEAISTTVEKIKTLSSQDGSHAGQNAIVPSLSDVFPLYLQTDPQWADIPYGSGTIKTNGCGLVCASMVLEHFSKKPYNPAKLVDIAQDDFLTDGINDLAKINLWVATELAPKCSIETFGPTDNLEYVNQLLHEDWIILGSCDGIIGDFETSPSGHIVVIYKLDDDGYHIRDPYCETNNHRTFSQEEFEQINWLSFYALRDGLV